MTLLIKNGRLIDPKSNRDEILDILIEENNPKPDISIDGNFPLL